MGKVLRTLGNMFVPGVAAINAYKKFKESQRGKLNEISDEELAANNPYKGTEYEKMYLENPWRNITYTPGFWDTMGNIFGWRTQEDDIELDAMQKAADYNAELAAKAQAEQHNSEIAQAERMNAAGLNPDLHNVDDKEAIDMNKPEAGIAADSTKNLESFTNGIIGAINFAIGMTGDLTQLSQARIDKQISLFNAALGTVSTGYEGAAPEIFGGKAGKNFTDFYNKLYESAYGKTARAKAKGTQYTSEIEANLLEGSEYRVLGEATKTLTGLMDANRSLMEAYKSERIGADKLTAEMDKKVNEHKKKLFDQLQADSTNMKLSSAERLFATSLLLGLARNEYDPFEVIGGTAKKAGNIALNLIPGGKGAGKVAKGIIGGVLK